MDWDSSLAQVVLVESHERGHIAVIGLAGDHTRSVGRVAAGEDCPSVAVPVVVPDVRETGLPWQDAPEVIARFRGGAAGRNRAGGGADGDAVVPCAEPGIRVVVF